MLVTCFSTPFSETERCRAIWLLAWPLASSASTLNSRDDSASSTEGPLRRTERVDDGGIEDGAAGMGAVDGADHGLEVADAVVEQVADVGGTAAQQLEGIPVAGFGDHDHAELGVLRAQVLGGRQ